MQNQTYDENECDAIHVDIMTDSDYSANVVILKSEIAAVQVEHDKVESIYYPAIVLKSGLKYRVDLHTGDFDEAEALSVDILVTLGWKFNSPAKV